MSRQLADLRLAVVMLDGIESKGRMNANPNSAVLVVHINRA